MCESNLLFVYGSLKCGHVNHPVLARAGGRFLGKAVTLSPFPLEQGPRWFRLLDRPGLGRRVCGELFRVPSAKGWSELDEFEGHPHGYRRTLHRVIAPSGCVEWAWVYFYRSSVGA